MAVGKHAKPSMQDGCYRSGFGIRRVNVFGAGGHFDIPDLSVDLHRVSKSAFLCINLSCAGLKNAARSRGTSRGLDRIVQGIAAGHSERPADRGKMVCRATVKVSGGGSVRGLSVNGCQVHCAPLRAKVCIRHSAESRKPAYSDFLNIQLICLFFVPPSGQIWVTLHHSPDAMVQNLHVNRPCAVVAETAGTCAGSARGRGRARWPGIW